MQIKVDLKGIEELKRTLDPKKFQRAIIRALDRTAKQGRVEAQRAIRSEYNIKLKDLSGHIKTDIHPSKMQAVISAKGSVLPLKLFNPRQVIEARDRKSGGLYSKLRKAKPGSKGVAGVTVMVKQGHRKLVRGGFMAKMPSGHIGVFKREGKARLPIRELFSVSMPKAFEKTIEAVKKRILEQWKKNIIHELTEGWKYGKKT